MRVTIEQTGPSVEAITARQIRELTAASKKLSGVIKKVGTAAVRRAVPYKSFAGYPLKVKAKATRTGTQTEVLIYGTPVGFWSMLESGAKPHAIRPRKGKALRLGSETFYADVNHPGMAGRGVWSNARPALQAALDKAIGDTYDAVLT